MKPIYIYGLTFENQIRYVGKANNVEKRFKDHFFEAYNPNNKSYNLPKSRWIRKHIKIEYVIIEECNENNWQDREMFWINNLPNLLNVSKGGDGGSKPIMDQQTKNKISEKAKGRKASEETKLKMSLKRKGVKKDWMKLPGEKNYNAKSVYQYDLQGNFIKKWNYQKEAVLYYGMSLATITNCIKGRQKSARGFIWKREKIH